ncbi:MAG TPA: hypothetical protein VJX68_08405 [Candidatus Binatus sp.]|nr:hypothetical protein [Candidatus Binatus sp.]HKN13204.1 hypothetical protein [Candidatus Binatus sp.]
MDHVRGGACTREQVKIVRARGIRYISRAGGTGNLDDRWIAATAG